MKFIKLSLLVLPFMVMADNPVAPMDVDSVEQNSSNQTAQVEERSVGTSTFETSSSYDDSQGIEDVIVTATRKETNILKTPIAWPLALKQPVALLISSILNLAG